MEKKFNPLGNTGMKPNDSGQTAAQRALARVTGEPVTNPVQQAQIPTTVQNTSPVQEEAPIEYDIGDVSEPPKTQMEQNVEEVRKELLPKELLPETIEDEVDEAINPNENIAKNFGNLRKKAKADLKRRQEVEAELEANRLKLQEYETGLAVPELYQQQADRIAKLERYEVLYALEDSPAFQEKIVKPKVDEINKFSQIAKDNQVDPAILDQLLSTTDNLQRNRILSQHFKDEVSILEAKSIVKNIEKLDGEAAALRKDPANSLAALQSENERFKEERKMAATKAVVDSSKRAWINTLTELKADKRFPEFSFRDGDTQYNEQVVRPMLTKAAQEYSRFIKGFVDAGGNQLTDDMAKASAKLFLLAHQSAAATVERDRLLAENADLKKRLGVRADINRPGVTGNNVTPSQTPGQKPVGGRKAAQNAFARGNSGNLPH